MTLEIRVKKFEDNLTPSESSIISYILRNKPLVLSMTIDELSEKLYYSRSSVFRLLKKLEYKGFNDLKKEIVIDKIIDKSSNKYLDNFIIPGAFKLFNNHNLSVINKLIERINNKNNIHIYGRGFSKDASLIFSKELNKIGYQANFFRDKYEMNSFRKNSIIILISFSGKGEHLHNILKEGIDKLSRDNVFQIYGNQIVNKANIINVEHESPLVDKGKEIPLIASNLFLIMINFIIWSLLKK